MPGSRLLDAALQRHIGKFHDRAALLTDKVFVMLEAGVAFVVRVRVIEIDTAKKPRCFEMRDRSIHGSPADRLLVRVNLLDQMFDIEMSRAAENLFEHNSPLRRKRKAMLLAVGLKRPDNTPCAVPDHASLSVIEI
jgi:hypothetical protein